MSPQDEVEVLRAQTGVSRCHWGPLQRKSEPYQSMVSEVMGLGQSVLCLPGAAGVERRLSPVEMLSRHSSKVSSQEGHREWVHSMFPLRYRLPKSLLEESSGEGKT